MCALKGLNEFCVGVGQNKCGLKEVCYSISCSGFTGCSETEVQVPGVFNDLHVVS